MKTQFIFNTRNILKLVALVLSIYIVILFFHRREDIYLLSVNPVSCCRHGFTEHLSTYAKTVLGEGGKEKRLIILAMTDASFVDMATNLYETSFKRFHIDNYLFVGTGNTSCDRLLQRGIHCLYYADDPSSNTSDSYGSNAFIRKMNIRTNMILGATAAGFTVLHTDLDVVFLSNPMPMLEELMFKHDLMIMWDYSAFNAGFLVINPTAFTRKVYLELQAKTNKSETLDDQKALNQVLTGVQGSDPSKYKELVHRLDENKFLCGKTYFEVKNGDFPPSDGGVSACDECMVVHNNWIVSKEAKVYRFKEALMWWVDAGGYYSGLETKYLTYDNPSNYIESLDARESEVAALKNAFALSQILKRTLVLPRFRCHGRDNPKECSLLNYLSIKHLDAVFPNAYRENSFFLHHLVPDDLKGFEPFYRSHYSQNSSKIPPSFTIKTKSNIKITDILTKNINNTQVLDFSSSEKVEEGSIVEKLGGVEDKVIHISSLFGVTVAFKDNHATEKFESSIKNAFVKKDYMQF